MNGPVFRRIDCLQIPVPDLEAGLAFYRDHLGHAVRWRSDTAVGLALPDSESEIVLHLERPELEANLLVSSVEEAAAAVAASGGAIQVAPFDIPVGRCAVVRDPWGNRLVLLDLSRGLFTTDPEGRVTGTQQA